MCPRREKTEHFMAKLLGLSLGNIKQTTSLGDNNIRIIVVTPLKSRFTIGNGLSRILIIPLDAPFQ